MSCKHNVNQLQVETANLVKYVRFHEINKNNVRKLLKSHAKPSLKDCNKVDQLTIEEEIIDKK